MAVTDLPDCIGAGIGGGGAIWSYTGTVVHTSVGGVSDYFTNGTSAGMKVGDILLYCKSDATKAATLHSVSVATAGGAVTVTAAILA